MELTLAKLSSLVTTMVQGRTDYTTSELSDYVNLALAELVSQVEMQSLDSNTVSSTTSGDSTLTFPSGANYITSVVNLSAAPNSEFRVLRPTSPEQIDSGTTQVGTPQLFAVYRNQVLLWPSVDSAYTMQIRFQERVPALLSSASTPGIDVRFHYAVALRASAIAASMRNDIETEAFNQARYLGHINSVPSDQAQKQRSRPSTFRFKWRGN